MGVRRRGRGRRRNAHEVDGSHPFAVGCTRGLPRRVAATSGRRQPRQARADAGRNARNSRGRFVVAHAELHSLPRSTAGRFTPARPIADVLGRLRTGLGVAFDRVVLGSARSPPGRDLALARDARTHRVADRSRARRNPRQALAPHGAVVATADRGATLPVDAREREAVPAERPTPRRARALPVRADDSARIARRRGRRGTHSQVHSCLVAHDRDHNGARWCRAAPHAWVVDARRVLGRRIARETPRCGARVEPAPGTRSASLFSSAPSSCASCGEPRPCAEAPGRRAATFRLANPWRAVPKARGRRGR